MAPELKVFSGKYPYKSFELFDEKIDRGSLIFPENAVLGLQAEAIFEAYLKQSRNYKLLAANLQIHTATKPSSPNKKETLGELDYIVQNLKTGAVVHIELACKYFLYDKNSNGTEAKKWIGPNRKDSLYEKLEKLRQKQFPLLKRPETLQKLETLGIPKPSLQQLCLKGFLFIPKNMHRESFPKNIQNCIVGHYLNPADLLKDGDAQYAVPSKKEWLLPINAIDNWYGFSKVQQLIAEQLKKHQSSLVYKKTRQKVERFFVVWW